MSQRSTERIRRLVVLIVAAIAPCSARGQGGEAESLSASFRKASRAVLPAVVTVRVAEPPPIRVGPLEFAPADAARRPGGSGVVIDAARGLVLTNDHVVDGGGPVVVTLPDGSERIASGVRRDPRSDLALLTIPVEGLVAADWGDSEALEIGDWVLAIGQPFGLSGTVTAGIVSGKGRAIGEAFYEDLIQTDAAINPGNSGGPLVDMKGHVVGITTAIKSVNGGYEGVGFAVPSARARRVADDLARFGRVRRAQVGIRVGAAPPGVVGAPIQAVGQLGPAAEAGVRTGDLIVKVGDRPVTGPGMLPPLIEFAPIGEPLPLTIRRGEQTLVVEVRPVAQAEAAVEPIAPRPIRPLPEVEGVNPLPPAVERPRADDAGAFPDLGLRLAEPTEGPGSSRGPVVRVVEPEGPADRGGFEPGMVIVKAGSRPVESLNDLRRIVTSSPAGSDLIFEVLRGARTEFRVIAGDRPRPDPAPPPASLLPAQPPG